MLAANLAYSNTTDILTWNAGVVKDENVLTVSTMAGTNTWSAPNTGISITANPNGSSIAQSLTFPVTQFDTSKWTNDTAKSEIQNASGKNITDFSSTGTGLFIQAGSAKPGQGLNFKFTGFEVGKTYKLGMLIQTEGTLSVRTMGQVSGLEIVCHYGNMGDNTWTQVTNDFTGASIGGSVVGGTFVVFDITATAGGNFFTLNFDDITNYDGKTPNSSIDFIAITAVPEPSAFGMLAGLSSVALVASRRKRNRRR